MATMVPQEFITAAKDDISAASMAATMRPWRPGGMRLQMEDDGERGGDKTPALQNSSRTFWGEMINCSRRQEKTTGSTHLKLGGG